MSGPSTSRAAAGLASGVEEWWRTEQRKADEHGQAEAYRFLRDTFQKGPVEFDRIVQAAMREYREETAKGIRNILRDGAPKYPPTMAHDPTRDFLRYKGAPVTFEMNPTIGAQRQVTGMQQLPAEARQRVSVFRDELRASKTAYDELRPPDGTPKVTGG